jgi:3-oxoacyl-[acyl-carrier protein] reductase
MPQKVAIITGGGTGVGRATSLGLAKLGYDVVVNYSRSRAEAESTAEEVQNLGSRSIAVQADVADDRACREMVSAALSNFGRVDVLVNCAAMTKFIPFPEIDKITDDVWEQLFKVNVVGAFHCARAVRDPMVQAGGGVIINVSSVAANLAQGSSIPYCCSKAALDNLTKSLARTFAPAIRVNGVAPGFITGRWLQGGLGANYDRVKQAYDESLPLGRVCDPEDVAACVISLITGSALVTGQTLTVDGGMTIAGYQVTIH